LWQQLQSNPLEYNLNLLQGCMMANMVKDRNEPRRMGVHKPPHVGQLNSQLARPQNPAEPKVANNRNDPFKEQALGNGNFIYKVCFINALQNSCQYQELTPSKKVRNSWRVKVHSFQLAP
jgi:hypothetical protein